MPNWKKVIVSGSDASLNSLLVSSSLVIGTSSLGSSENTLVIGLPPAGGSGEGGQLLLQAPNSGGFTSASMLDNWQNTTRLLRGTNAGSVAVVTQWNMHTSQIAFPAYNSVSAFAGTAVANLAVDSSGNIITVSTSGGSVFPYTGIAAINGGLVVTGSITASGAIHAQANGAMYFRGGDDAEFWDINTVNTVGIYGQQDQGVASIKLGSGGGTISGRSGSIGIGTITPTSASLTVNGNVWATSFTGSLQGTSSWTTNALTASSADNFTVRGTLTAQTIVVQTITSSVDFVTGSTRFGSLTSNTHLFTGSVGMTGSLTVIGSVSASSFTGSLLGTSSYATNADTLDGNHASAFVLNSQTSSMSVATASFVTTAQTASYVLTAQTASFVNLARSASYVLQAVSASFATSATNATTASYVLQAVSASFATSASRAISSSFTTTASFAANGGVTQIIAGTNITISPTNGLGAVTINASGGGSSFPYTGSAVITGSLILTGSFDIGPAEFNATSSATTAGTTIVSTYATGSANSAFYNYYISSGSNARAGQIMSVWSGSSIQYSEVTTNDIGNTNTASFAVTLATGNVRLSFTAPGVWTVRSIVNLL